MTYHELLTISFLHCRDAEKRNLVISQANASELFPELICWHKEEQHNPQTSTQTKPMKNESSKAKRFATIPMHANRAPRPMVSTKPMVPLKAEPLNDPRRKPDAKKMQRQDMLPVSPTRGKTKKRKSDPARDANERSGKKYPKIPDTR